MLRKGITIIMVYISLFSLSAQTISGKWKTIDDETGEEKSIVEIYEEDGKIFGKIIEVLNAKQENPVCNECKGKNKGKSIIGMIIIDGLTKEDNVYNGGTILNPSEGKVYKCRLKLGEDRDLLQVRGYVAFFYRTQYWKRVVE